jgi:ABC-2 type transport system permease protein
MIALYTLIKRETVRFIKDLWDTILPPTISALLFFIIFGIALGSRIGDVDGLAYGQFIVPGIILLAVINNSFLNPAYSLFQSRWDGNIADFLVTPLSTRQIATAIIIGGVIRGLIIGVLVSVFVIALGGVSVQNLHFAILFAILVSLMFASLGCIVGLWTKGWEGVGAISTFVLDPLVLLGGVFFSLDMVLGVPVIDVLARINPITYIMETFRYTIFGVSGANPLIGLSIVVGLAAFFLIVVFYLFRIGYNLKK